LSFRSRATASHGLRVAAARAHALVLHATALLNLDRETTTTLR
jgi:hypothetical protein